MSLTPGSAHRSALLPLLRWRPCGHMPLLGTLCDSPLAGCDTPLACCQRHVRRSFVAAVTIAAATKLLPTAAATNTVATIAGHKPSLPSRSYSFIPLRG